MKGEQRRGGLAETRWAETRWALRFVASLWRKPVADRGEGFQVNPDRPQVRLAEFTVAVLDHLGHQPLGLLPVRVSTGLEKPDQLRLAPVADSRGPVRCDVGGELPLGAGRYTVEKGGTPSHNVFQGGDGL